MKERCDKIRELLSPFLDGELAPEEKELVENHLIECEACQQEFARLKELDEAVSQIEVEEPSHEFHPRLIHTLSKEYAKRRKRRSFLIQLAPLAAAASILFVVLVSSQIFFIKYPTQSFRTRTLEKGVEPVSEIHGEEEIRTKAPATTEGRDLKEEEGIVAGKAAGGEVSRTEGYAETISKKETAEKSGLPVEKPEIAKSGEFRAAETPKAAKRGMISTSETQTLVTQKTNDELMKQKKDLERPVVEDKNKAVAGATEIDITAAQRPTTVQRAFDKTTRPRVTQTRNEFEVDVSSTDQVVQQIPEDQRVGILVDLDSVGNVLAAQLIKPTGSDTVDSTVIQNVRNQNFRVLTEGVKKFPTRQEIYYQFRQTGE